MYRKQSVFTRVMNWLNDKPDNNTTPPLRDNTMETIVINSDISKTIKHRLDSQPQSDIINHWHEEVGELMQAINKYRRHKPDAMDNLTEEIGDVLIMTLSLREIFGAELVDKAIMDKTAEKIKKHRL